MAYTKDIPQAGDAFNVSQQQILANFQFMGSTTGNAIPGFYVLPNGITFIWGNEGGPFPVDGGGFLSAAITYPVGVSLTAIYSVYLTARVGDSTSKRFFVDSDTPPSTTSFKIRTSTNDFDTIYWLVIGLS